MTPSVCACQLLFILINVSRFLGRKISGWRGTSAPVPLALER